MSSNSQVPGTTTTPNNDMTSSTDDKTASDGNKKKSKAWLWILIGGISFLLLIGIILVIVFSFNGFDSSDSNGSSSNGQSSSCSFADGVVPYSLDAAGGINPILTIPGISVNPPTYLTDAGSKIGTPSNPPILSTNSLAWVVVNTSDIPVALTMYYVNTDDTPNTVRFTYTEMIGSDSTQVWTDNVTGQGNPLFPGMTITFINSNIEEISPLYVVPSQNINTSTDIAVITVNSDLTATISIC